MGVSLVAQLVKNLPAMWETWVQSLGWEDPLEKVTATHSSILAWRIWWTIVHGVAKSWTRLSDFHFHVWSLFQVEYDHIHRILRYRILGLKHTLPWTGQSFCEVVASLPFRWMLTTQKGPWGNLPGWGQANTSTTILNRLKILSNGRRKQERLKYRGGIRFHTWGFYSDVINNR